MNDCGGRNMRKNILMIATVTMMAFAITACGSDSKDNETTKAETTAQDNN